MKNYFYVLALKDDSTNNIIKDKIYIAYEEVYNKDDKSTTINYNIINEISRTKVYTQDLFNINFKRLDIIEFDRDNPIYVYNNIILKQAESEGGGGARRKSSRRKSHKKKTRRHRRKSVRRNRRR
jgi:hypothetical protein